MQCADFMHSLQNKFQCYIVEIIQNMCSVNSLLYYAMNHIHRDCYAIEFYGRDGKKAEYDEVEEEEEEEE